MSDLDIPNEIAQDINNKIGEYSFNNINSLTKNMKRSEINITESINSVSINAEKAPKKVFDIQSHTKMQVDKVLARNEGLTEEIIRQNSGGNDIDRVKGLKNDFKLNNEQIKKVIDIHHNMDGVLLEHYSIEWWAKIGAMGEVGIDRKTAIKIMDLGYAGKIELPELSQNFLLRFNIPKYGENYEIIDALRKVSVELDREMNYDKMVEFLDFVKKNPGLFIKPQANIDFLKKRVLIFDELRDETKIESRFGIISQDKVLDYKTRVNQNMLNKLRENIKNNNYNDELIQGLNIIGIKFGIEGEGRKSRDLYSLSQQQLDGKNPVGNAIRKRIEQLANI